jgi:hypothetical protein
VSGVSNNADLALSILMAFCNILLKVYIIFNHVGDLHVYSIIEK